MRIGNDAMPLSVPLLWLFLDILPPQWQAELKVLATFDFDFELG